MKIIQFLTDASGTLVYPTELQKADVDRITSGQFYNQITLVFYNDIETDSKGIIIPINPVTDGLSGIVTVRARSTDDSFWSDIEDGVLDLSKGGNMAFPAGVIRSVQISCSGVTGCSYILVRVDRGV